MEDPNAGTCSIILKWGKQLFKDVLVPMSGGFELFQAQIYSLTSVLPERQKLLYKGKQIKELDPEVIKTGITLLLIGSSDENIKKPDSRSSDTSSKSEAEDQQVAQQKKCESNLPIILLNLGNTCYLNATIQFLRCIPELRTSLLRYNDDISNSTDPLSLHAISMTLALKDLFKTLDETPVNKKYSPLYLLDCLQMVAPSFAHKDKNGSLQQQDADECLSVILRLIHHKLPPLDDTLNKHRSFVEQYLTGKFSVESICKESNEPPATTEENFTKLSCFISQEVKFLVSGIRLSLNEELSKFNDSLQRDARYSRNYKISRLPAYLTIHFMRFYYKEKVNMNTKILREVKFPFMFDAYEFCTDELKQRLTDMREKFRLDEENVTLSRFRRSFYQSSTANKEEYYPFSFEDDSGSNNSGYYDLRAIITHKGRTSQAGHYVCWVKIHDALNGWVRVDDDIRTCSILEEDILHLAGGSDIHTAYMLLYGPRVLKRKVTSEKN